MKIRNLLLIIILLTGCIDREQEKTLHLVNPFIGTDGHGHTYPGASLPFGMVQLSPDTRKDSWDGCSGYHYTDSTIAGFSHTHLSGTGVGDYGDIRFMPMTGALKIRPGQESDPDSGYRSRFSHQDEKASPGYYQVYLKDYQINVELTVTSRCGFHQYTFPENDEAYIIIDLTESVVTERNLDLGVEIINDCEMAGFRKSSGWATDQAVYFYATFSRPFDDFGISEQGVTKGGLKRASGKDIQAYVKYRPRGKEKIQVKVGISAVSIEGAKNNLQSEINHWKFNRIKEQAEVAWANELGKIKVKGGTTDDQIKFYTALYHAFLAPNLFTDIDGRYRGNDGNIHLAQDFTAYTVFSLWDTYRALHPLLTFLQPERTADFIKTFIDIRDKRGLLPVWELAGNETYCMIGYHAVPVIADAYLKGIKGFDIDKAYDAACNSAEKEHFGLESYKRSGYIPAEKEGEAISKTLEYAYDDWCIAMMAKKLGKEEDYQYYIRRAQFYKNLYDPETRFIRGKRNGMFTQPFDPAEVNFMLTEANTWQYTFYVPQDIQGLKELMGSDLIFEQKLDELFSGSSMLAGRQQADITGLIGQYAHGNEPSHHVAYLYNYVGKPFKTQKLTRQIMSELYGPGPDGLCGNEDCGQMSAWFVFSALGFYPVTPGSGDYIIGSPLFEEVQINLANGKKFKVKANFNNSSNIYIQSATLNGETYTNSYLSHNDLVKGGELSFVMDSRPNISWAAHPEEWPVSAIEDHLILPVPYFNASSNSFQGEISLALHHINPDAKIFYGEGHLTSSIPALLYSDSITVYRSSIFSAVAIIDSLPPSMAAHTVLHKMPHEWKIAIKHPYSPQYTGGGDLALIDGQRGGANFRTGCWQGYYGINLEVMIDMGRNRNVNKIMASFLQDQNSWIFLPEEVEFAISNKPFDFRTIAILKSGIPDYYSDPVIEEFNKDLLKVNGRYLKVIARNKGTCPPWHIGAGEKAWIFADEISVE